MPTPPSKLSSAEIRDALALLPSWKRKGSSILRTYEFKDFPTAIRFVGRVATLAEKAWHHPDIDIRWNKVTLVFSTHDAGGLTGKDFDLAGRCDKLCASKAKA